MEFGTGGFSTTGHTVERGKAVFPDFGNQVGFKIGAGLDWLYGNYTRLKTKNKESSLVTTGDLWLLWETSGGIPSFSTVLSGKNRAGLTFNVLDLDCAPHLALFDSFSLQPFFGLKGSWQTQDFTNHFVITSSNTFSQHFHQEYWGLGIRGGCQSFWQIASCFGLYGDMSLSGLWSSFINKRKDKELAGSLASLFIHTRGKSNALVPVLELGLGASFDFRQFSFDLGWELQLWWGMNHIIGLHDLGPHGNLILQGLTCKAGVAF